MVDKRARLQVFAASPSDTQEERTSLRAVVEELNLGVADSCGIVLELVGWETHSWPGVGSDAQDVINHEISSPDVVVGIFWKRLGTPTSRAASGSVEEIDKALELRAAGMPVEVLIYFNEASYSPREDELEQIAGVFKFRHELERRGLLISTYSGLEDFKTKVSRHLTQIVRRWPVGGEGVAASLGEKPRSPRQESGSPRAWFDQLAAGHLSIEIAPSLGGRTYALIAAVSKALEEAGFEIKTRDRVSIILTELLTNVANHAGGNAKVDIDIQAEIFKTVRVSVESTGRRFNLDKIINKHVAKLERGVREHGLLRVRRLSGAMGYHYDVARNSTSVFSEVYEIPRPNSVLYNSSVVAPIRSEYGTPPRFLWIGAEAYTGPALGLLRRSGSAVRGLFFDPLTSLNLPWLGIEFTGEVFVTIDEREPVYIEPAIEDYFRPMFQNHKVLVIAHHTSSNVTRAAAEWAKSRGLEFYDNETALSSRLARIPLKPA